MGFKSRDRSNDQFELFFPTLGRSWGLWIWISTWVFFESKVSICPMRSLDGKKRKCHLWTGGINPKSDNQVEITSHNHEWIKVDTFKIMFSWVQDLFGKVREKSSMGTIRSLLNCRVSRKCHQWRTYTWALETGDIKVIKVLPDSQSGFMMAYYVGKTGQRKSPTTCVISTSYNQ